VTYLQRIAECNRAELRRFRPLLVGNDQIGWLRHDLADVLGERVEAGRRLDGVAARTEAFAAMVAELQQRGLAPAGTGERIAVSVERGAPVLLELERSAAPCFGVRSYGVHVNGYVRRDGRLWTWLARRAMTRAEYPGMWDNLVGGGLRAGCSLDDDLQRECAEEAGIDPDRASRARAAGLISYCREVPHGLAPNLAFVFDLELDPDFQPEAVDGEVDRFVLMPVEEVAALVAETVEVKPNCNLVIIDFLVRHGVIPPETPHYVEIVRRLRSGPLPRLDSALETSCNPSR